MEFRSKNLLVTGGAGFIGSNFIHYFFKNYKTTNVYNLDLLTYAGNLNNTSLFRENPRYKFIKGNICNKKLLNKIFREYKIDGVINFAAETHVDNSIKFPEKFIKSNINGVFNLLNCTYENWMSSPFKPKKEFLKARIHQISTDEVYGSIKKGSFNEHDQYNPNSPYSASKAAADMLVRSFNKTFGLNTTISISSNNYGYNQNLEKFIPKVIHRIINNDDIPLYGDGNNIRDWIFVKDHCIAIQKIFNESSSGGTYNVGGNLELSNIKLVNIVHNIIRKYRKVEKKIIFVDDRFGHDFRYSLNTKKIKNILNWQPVANFEFELEKYILKLLENE